MENMHLEALTSWKSGWSSLVKTLNTMQDQGQKTLDLYFSQTDQMRNEILRTLKEGLKTARETQMAYLKAVEENVDRWEEMASRAASVSEPVSSPQRKSERKGAAAKAAQSVD